jgi:20S proteasome alpha/beta subunit
MTLILGATNGRQIIVGADTLVYEGSGEVYRTYQTPKLRVVNGGKWIIGFTGLAGVAHIVWDYLEAKGQTFDPDIRIGALQCIDEMGKIYTQHHLEPNARAMLAGFLGDRPHIYTWNLAKPIPSGGELPPWGAIGCGSDVALHYVRNCHPMENLDVENLSALVYFSISEIANSDIRVGKPIDIGVVRKDGAAIEPRESILRLEPMSERLSSLIRKEILGLVVDG